MEKQGMDHRLVFQSPDIQKHGSGHTLLPAGIWFKMLLPPQSVE
jgi:hypothetical protein